MANTKKKLSPELTEHIARLAHIELSQDEKEKFTEQMNSILGHFTQLEEVDIEGIEPTTHVMDIKNVFREDVIVKGLTQQQAIENASETQEGHIKAPKII